MRREILAGSTRVKLEGRNFVFTNAYQDSASVFIDHADALEVIMFMYQWSDKIQTDLADAVGASRALPTLSGASV